MSTTPTDIYADMTNGGHDTTTKVTGRTATIGACPFRGTRGGAIGSEPQLDHWWPNRLKVELLHQTAVPGELSHSAANRRGFIAGTDPLRLSDGRSGQA